MSDCVFGDDCPRSHHLQVDYTRETKVDFNGSRAAWDDLYEKNLITKKEYLQSVPGLDNMKSSLPPTPKDLAEKAISLVYGDRNEDYGHPADDYKRTAELWSALLGYTIHAHEAALMMVLVKLSREMNKHKDDNMVDAHGYLLVAGRILAREEGNE